MKERNNENETKSLARMESVWIFTKLGLETLYEELKLAFFEKIFTTVSLQKMSTNCRIFVHLKTYTSTPKEHLYFSNPAKVSAYQA